MTSLIDAPTGRRGGKRWFAPGRVGALVPLIVWTLFVWTSRIRNIWIDDDISTGGQVLRTFFAVVFISLGLVALWLWRRHRPGELDDSGRWMIAVFLAWTVGFWLVRGIGIIVDDHTLGFTVVHTVLMLISFGLAALAAQTLRPARS